VNSVEGVTAFAREQSHDVVDPGSTILESVARSAGGTTSGDATGVTGGHFGFASAGAVSGEPRQ
jgi:hypothetical protein